METWGLRSFGLTRRFGPVQAVRGVNLSVAAGEFCTLLGTPGAGKSALLRLLATDLRPHAGSFELAGQCVNSWQRFPRSLAAVRRQLGYFPEEPGHFLDLTPAESSWLFGQAYGLDPGDLRTRINILLEWAGLAPLARQPLRALDYGQRRRLALIQALLHRPRVLLLDDPGRGQEPAFRQQLAELLRTVAAGGTAIILAADRADGVPLPPDLAAAHRKLNMQGGRLAC